MNNFFYGEINANDIPLDVNELSLRLMTKKQSLPENINDYEGILKQSINAKYTAKIVDIVFIKDSVILEGVTIKSNSLIKNLKGCSKGIILCVTLGNLVDKTINKYSLKSTYEHFLVDAIYSSLCESLCDLVDKKLTKNYKTKNRFSVGYGDCDIKYQKSVLDTVNAKKYLNVKLSDSYLMTPTKTITAIIGIENENS